MNNRPSVPIRQTGDDETHTLATLTDGRLVIDGENVDAKDLGINTELSEAHSRVKELPSLQRIVAQQKAVAQAVSTISTATQTAINNQRIAAQKAVARARREFEEALQRENPDAWLEYLRANEEEREAFRLINSAEYRQSVEEMRDWGLGGEKSRLVSTTAALITGALSGQGNLQLLGNAVAPYAAKLIGDQLGENGELGTKLLAHAALGAIFAYANNVDPTIGMNSALVSVITIRGMLELFNDGKTAIDPITHEFDPNLLPEEIKNEILSLTNAIVFLMSSIKIKDLADKNTYVYISDVIIINNEESSHQKIKNSWDMLMYGYRDSDSGVLKLDQLTVANKVLSIEKGGKLHDTHKKFLEQIAYDNNKTFIKTLNFGDLNWAMGTGTISGVFSGTTKDLGDGRINVVGEIIYVYHDEFKDSLNTLNLHLAFDFIKDLFNGKNVNDMEILKSKQDEEYIIKFTESAIYAYKTGQVSKIEELNKNIGNISRYDIEVPGVKPYHVIGYRKIKIDEVLEKR